MGIPRMTNHVRTERWTRDLNAQYLLTTRTGVAKMNTVSIIHSGSL